jgi:hypothetical protein
MTQQLRERNDKWDNMKLKNFCTTKEMVTILKRQPIEWEKIFASYTSNDRLITRIYCELKRVNSPQKINEPIKKWANEVNRAFPKEEVKMVKKHMRKCSISLLIKQMQINTTLRFYLIPVIMTVIKKTNNKFW